MYSFPYTHTPYLVHTVQELQEHDIGVLMILWAALLRILSERVPKR